MGGVCGEVGEEVPEFSVVVGGEGEKKKKSDGGGRSQEDEPRRQSHLWWWAWLGGTGRAQQLNRFSQIQLSLVLSHGASFHNPLCSIMTQSSRP